MPSLQEGLQVSPSRRLGTTGSGCEQERELELLVEADQEQLVLEPGQRGSVDFNGENLAVQAGRTSVPAYPRTCGEMRKAEHWVCLPPIGLQRQRCRGGLASLGLRC